MTGMNGADLRDQAGKSLNHAQKRLEIMPQPSQLNFPLSASTTCLIGRNDATTAKQRLRQRGMIAMSGAELVKKLKVDQTTHTHNLLKLSRAKSSRNPALRQLSTFDMAELLRGSIVSDEMTHKNEPSHFQISLSGSTLHLL